MDKAILTLPNNHTPPKPNQAALTPRMRPRIALQRKVTHIPIKWLHSTDPVATRFLLLYSLRTIRSRAQRLHGVLGLSSSVDSSSSMGSSGSISISCDRTEPLLNILHTNIALKPTFQSSSPCPERFYFYSSLQQNRSRFPFSKYSHTR